MEVCRTYGIARRDIKPDNPFCSPETGRYKLGNFGVAHYPPGAALQRKGRAVCFGLMHYW